MTPPAVSGGAPAPVSRRAVLGLVGVAAAMGLSACVSSEKAAQSVTPTGALPQAGNAGALGSYENPVRLMVYGDSITRGGKSDLVVGSPSAQSWLAHLGDGLRWVGGAAVNGATGLGLAAMRVDTPPADVAVYFFGTNDLLRGRSVAQMVAEIRAFHEALPSAVRPPTVALVDVGPMGGRATAPRLTAWNAALASAAAQRGWTVVDPWTTLRKAASGEGYAEWARGEDHLDALHPTVLGSERIGASLGAAVLAYVRGGAPSPTPTTGAAATTTGR